MIPLVLSGCLLAGCAAREPMPEIVLVPDTRMVQASRVIDRPEPENSVIEVKVPVTSPQLRHAPTPFAPATRPADVLSTVASALSLATVRPRPADFVEAVQHYDYAPGVVYSVVTCPGYLTTLALRPGEKVLTVSAGDTVGWSVEPVETGGTGGTATGAGNSRTLVLIKPRKPFLQTNLVIATDERVYLVELTSVAADVYHTMVAWNYPFGDVVIARNRAAEARRREEATAATGVDLTKVNFDYLVLKQAGPTPAWAPLRTFDDGSKTYIEFPPGLASSESPPLFVLGKNGDAQLVNYRVRGDYYVVDRLFDRAELRAGQAPQSVVRIVRAEAKDGRK